MQARLDDPKNAAIANSLRQVGINSAVELFGTYAGHKTRHGRMAQATRRINRDRNLRPKGLRHCLRA